MDRIKGGSEPLYNQAPSRFGPPPEAAAAQPAYAQDQFTRIRPRTPEQKAGMKPLDTAAIVSMVSGGVGLLGGLGLLGAAFAGILAGPGILVLGGGLALVGLVAAGLGFSRWKSREALLREG